MIYVDRIELNFHLYGSFFFIRISHVSDLEGRSTHIMHPFLIISVKSALYYITKDETEQPVYIK